jgi:hypothetical protein
MMNVLDNKLDIIVDMDGTLANITERVELANSQKDPITGKMNWDTFLDPEVMRNLDQPNTDVVLLVRSLAETGHRILITSARNERHRDVTEWQLKTWQVPYIQLHLRADEDYRQDAIIKSEILEKIKDDGFNPTVAIDDRNQVVQNWRKLGLKCWQVRVTTA